MRLCIADPGYPPQVGATSTKVRSSRWYGDGQLSVEDRPADFHEDAARWDDPAQHRALLLRLMDEFDGWAIATSPDGIAAYWPLPRACRLMAWTKPRVWPGSHRLGSYWEPVILYPAEGRRSNRGGVGMVSDVFHGMAPNDFIGAKPYGWTHWVLDALSYDPSTDTVCDLFNGSGAVADAIHSWVPISERGRPRPSAIRAASVPGPVLP